MTYYIRNIKCSLSAGFHTSPVCRNKHSVRRALSRLRGNLNNSPNINLDNLVMNARRSEMYLAEYSSNTLN